METLEFKEIIKDIIKNEKVQEMKKYKQHCDTTTFEHCYMVSYYSYKVCKKLRLDYKLVARAGMLHDFYLYDWREKTNRSKWHAFTHGRTSCENANKIFDLSKKEQDMIIKHMWPLTLAIPHSPEGMVLSLVDKYCACSEICKYYLKNIQFKKMWRYAYIMVCYLFIKIK